MPARGGQHQRSLRRVLRATLVAGLACALGLGAVSVAAKKKSKKLPRGPYPSLGKCGVFPQSNAAPNAPSAADQTAWNQDISQAPLDPNSGAIVNHILANGGDSVHPDFGSPREYGFPYAVVGKKQKKVKVNFTAYGDESDHGAYRVPLKALVEGGAASDGDRHVLAVDRARCKLFELYRAFPKKTPKPHWNADSGVIFNLGSAANRPEGYTSADAAGLPIFPGLANFDQARSGTINHAFRMTVSSTRNAYINPAVHCAGDTSSAAAPPMGLRMRLNAGYNINNFTGEARAIAVALKRYGVIIADNGSNFYISGTSDKRWNDENLNQLKGIPGDQFEVVRSAAPVHTC